MSRHDLSAAAPRRNIESKSKCENLAAARDAALRLTPARLALRQAGGIWSWRPAPGFPRPAPPAAAAPRGR